jgi:glycosyltransferase involved in cell wall biosynthesis
MTILFVHQNFPGQFKHIMNALAHQSHIALCIENPVEALPQAWQVYRYGISQGNQPGLIPWLQDLETKTIRGEACAKAANHLRKNGLTPSLIVGHPGWGELTFLRDIWKDVPIITYQEIYYQPEGFDYDFDPELQAPLDWQSRARLKLKTVNQQLSLQLSHWCVSPTRFQRSSFPKQEQFKISTIHDGIDTATAKPSPENFTLKINDHLTIAKGELIVTFVNRTLEPYRGCHTFIRSIPRILKIVPGARIIIVGETKGVSYGASCAEGEWADQFLREIEGQYDPSRVHFVGKLPYEQFIPLLQISAAHVYLTYPFVLSWSLLEAMSCEAPIVGSATAPLMEVIQHGHNGLLVDFFKPNDLAEAVAELLNNRERAQELGRNARQTILQHYSLEKCVPRHLALMDLVASGALGRDPD